MDPSSGGLGSPAARHSALLHLLRERIAREGPLPFPEFLREALYHPHAGYYHGGREILGARGDYQTAPRVSPLFGAVLAQHIGEIHLSMGRPSNFSLMELGPGDGSLLRDVWASLERGRPRSEVGGWKVRAVEVSSTLREQALQNLSGAAAVSWYDSLEGIAPAEGVVWGNEFLDSLPFHRLVVHEGRWCSLLVDAPPDDPTRLVETVGPPVPDDWGRELPRDVPEGTMLERISGLPELFRSLARMVPRGHLIFFDYGDTRERLLARFPRGTLQTFHRHEGGLDPFRGLGSTDITAWVDFTYVQEVARGSGFHVSDYLDQSEALHRWGLDAVTEALVRTTSDPVEQTRIRMARKTYLFAYPTFRVLELVRQG